MTAERNTVHLPADILVNVGQLDLSMGALFLDQEARTFREEGFEANAATYDRLADFMRRVHRHVKEQQA